MIKPRIIIPLAYGGEPKESPRLFARCVYTEMIERTGGVPLMVARPENPEDFDPIAEAMDGLFIMGGVDAHPKRYGESIHTGCGEIDEGRDRVELELIKRAYDKKIPILGVCRGLQIINTYFGGTLYQDIPSEFPSTVLHKSDDVTERKKLVHMIHIEPSSHLDRILGQQEFMVNSLHHQGIKTIGSGLLQSAHAPDGLIEGIEHPDYPFCLGVQWHPEELNDEPSLKLFQAFIKAAKAR